MKHVLKYSAGLIAIYLVVANGTQAGRAFRSGSRGTGHIIRAFQGR